MARGYGEVVGVAEDMSLDWSCFSSRRELAKALAASLASESRLRESARALFALSGGKTPSLFLEALSCEQLDWQRLSITLVDERWVGEDDSRSNAALLRRHLLAKRPEIAFHPLYNAAPSPQAGLKALQQRMAAVFATGVCALVLGMGEDGHTASLFPHAFELKHALDLRRRALLCAIQPRLQKGAAGEGQLSEARLSLTLRGILQARALYLHIEGEGKRRTLERALEDMTRRDEWHAMPIRSVLAHRGKDLRVFYCP